MTVELPDGKQIVVNSDLGQVRVSLWANRGCLGVTLTPEEAVQVSRALWYAAQKRA
jgi:hypothetical protein